MDKREVTYDPTDAQLETLVSFRGEDLKLDDLTNEQAVYFLIQQQKYSLYALKASNSEKEKLLKDNEILKDDRENLRVKLAENNALGGIAWAEILISFLGGFAINMLTDNPRDGLGWVLFILSIFILFSLRIPRLSKWLEDISSRSNNNG